MNKLHYDYVYTKYEKKERQEIMQKWIDALELIIPRHDPRRMFFDAVYAKVVANDPVTDKQFSILKNMYLKAMRDE